MIINDRNIAEIDDKRFYCTDPDRDPQVPYRFEKTINKDSSYLIDADGIVWIKQHVEFIQPEQDYGICYTDACLIECMFYITSREGFDAYQNIKKYVGENLIPYKEAHYDLLLKEYDKTIIKEQEEEND